MKHVKRHSPSLDYQKTASRTWQHNQIIFVFNQRIHQFLKCYAKNILSSFFFNDTQSRNASVPHVSHKLSKLKQFIFQKKKILQIPRIFFHQPVYPRLARLRMGHNVYIFPTTKNEIRRMYRTWNN